MLGLISWVNSWPSWSVFLKLISKILYFSRWTALSHKDFFTNDPFPADKNLFTAFPDCCQMAERKTCVKAMIVSQVWIFYYFTRRNLNINFIPDLNKSVVILTASHQKETKDHAFLVMSYWLIYRLFKKFETAQTVSECYQLCMQKNFLMLTFS